MSETLRILAGIALLVAIIITSFLVFADIFDFLLPATFTRSINQVIIYGSNFISQARGLINWFVLEPKVVTGCLTVFVFAKPLLIVTKLAFKVTEYFVKGY